MQILERMFRNERTMKAVFGLGSEKFDELAGRMKILHIEKLAGRKFSMGYCEDVGVDNAVGRATVRACHAVASVCLIPIQHLKTERNYSHENRIVFGRNTRTCRPRLARHAPHL
jgi:hypothetical protein